MRGLSGNDEIFERIRGQNGQFDRRNRLSLSLDFLLRKIDRDSTATSLPLEGVGLRDVFNAQFNFSWL